MGYQAGINLVELLKAHLPASLVLYSATIAKVIWAAAAALAVAVVTAGALYWYAGKFSARKAAKTSAKAFVNSPLRKCRFQFAVGARRMVTTSAAGSASMSAIRPKTSSESVCKTKMKAARASAASLGVP